MKPAFLARCLVLTALAIVPLRIVASGYLPDDDALRHVAKAVSGRPWSDVLVLRPDVTMDSHPGWHALLGAVHRATGATAPSLLVFSVVALLLALLLPAAMLARRPEAWALALAAFATFEPRILSRFASGRPFVLSDALLVVLCLLAARLPADAVLRPRPFLLLMLGLGLAAWIHPSWYLFLLPVAACLLARRWKLAATLAAALALGVVVAGLLYGHPLQFVGQSVFHAWLAMGSPAPPGTLAIEFLPGDGSPLLVLSIAALLLWRKLRGAWRQEAVAGPVFTLVLLGWLLGRLVIRFWSDWGAIAALVWIAGEIEEALEGQLAEASPLRVPIAAIAGLAAFVACTASLHGGPLVDRPFLPLASPAADAALPQPGGILYTDDERLFYQLFYSRPNAPFRYIVGYEPALMPAADLAVFRGILAERTPARFAPWIAKMRPEDRLILRSTGGRPPLPALEWTQVSQSIWSGRVPAPAAR
jgi:hypothetical protein